jgi:pimeloyl-ACP methyl ester carboxylesterase
MHVQSHVAVSADGVPIHYEVQGNGATALVFVHGWCCNRRFWDPQVEHFASHYTVVCIDVGGHGTSGRERTQWTVPAFGQDIVAVVKQQGLEQVVLIGHSMGGSWIVEAARHLPRAVIGVIGADTWPNTEQAPTPAQVAEILAPFRTNFVEAMHAFVRALFVPTSDPALVEHVMATMSAAPPPMAISARESVLRNVPDLQAGFRQIQAPKMLIYAEDWRPPNMAAMQRWGIEVVPMSGVGHFMMMEAPQTFNRLLDEAVRQCLHRKAP